MFFLKSGEIARAQKPFHVIFFFKDSKHLEKINTFKLDAYIKCVVAECLLK